MEVFVEAQCGNNSKIELKYMPRIKHEIKPQNPSIFHTLLLITQPFLKALNREYDLLFSYICSLGFATAKQLVFYK